MWLYVLYMQYFSHTGWPNHHSDQFNWYLRLLTPNLTCTVHVHKRGKVLSCDWGLKNSHNFRKSLLITTHMHHNTCVCVCVCVCVQQLTCECMFLNRQSFQVSSASCVSESVVWSVISRCVRVTRVSYSPCYITCIIIITRSRSLEAWFGKASSWYKNENPRVVCNIQAVSKVYRTNCKNSQRATKCEFMNNSNSS